MEHSAAALSRKGKPLFCNLIVSRRCFFNCQMCLNWKTVPEDKPLTLIECKRFIDELTELVDYKLDINIMGGEPLMIDWILPLCDYMYKKGLGSIMSTNGYLINQEMAKNIGNSHLEFLGISLDGMKAETHDTIRGMKGSHARIVEAIEHFKKYCHSNFTVTLLTIILQKNLEELPDLVKWMGEIKGINIEISFTALLECGLVQNKEGWFRQPEYRGIWPDDPKKVEDIVDELIFLKKQGYRIVNPFSQLEAFKEYYRDPEKFLRETDYCIHDYIIDLDPSTDVFLSGHPLGSMKGNTGLKEMWFSEKADGIRKYIDEFGCESSRSCLINFICAFNENKGQRDHDINALHFQAKRYGKMGYFYQQQGKYELAIQYFQKAVEKNARNASLHMGAAFNYLKLKRYQAAMEEYAEAFRLDPGLMKEAEADYEEALLGSRTLRTDKK